MSDNQKQFTKDAGEQGYDVWQYSGRRMYGEKCPAVSVDDHYQFNTKARVKWETLGLGYVVYAQD